MSALVNWLLPSSIDTLEEIYFNDNSANLTRTPLQLGTFKKVSRISIRINLVNMTISAGSVFSGNPGMAVDIPNSNIGSVEEGAFLGK